MSQQLTIETLGVTIDVEEGQTILDAALRQGIYIPHACGHGLCGTCKVISWMHLSDAPRLLAVQSPLWKRSVARHESCCC